MVSPTRLCEYVHYLSSTRNSLPHVFDKLRVILVLKKPESLYVNSSAIVIKRNSHLVLGLIKWE
jgi:hypothetical protein